MKIIKTPKMITLFVMLSFLYGCSSAQVKTEVEAKNLGDYENILIKEVRVYSNEPAAKKNFELHKKLDGWKVYSRSKLEEYIKSGRYNLIDTLGQTAGETLLVDLDVNVQYGNRALRWAVGFGAGKGGVETVLTVTDSISGDVKYKTNAISELSMGAAGGDVGSVLKDNIRVIIKQLRAAEAK